MMKLTHRFVRQYEVLKKIGVVAYLNSLLSLLLNIDNVFHVSQLMKCVHDMRHVVQSDIVYLNDNLTFEALPKRILVRKNNTLKGKKILQLKVI